MGAIFNFFLILILGTSLSSGPVVKNLPCNERDSSLIPGGGTKIPHIVVQIVRPMGHKY